MTARGVPRGPNWSPRQVVKLRWYAERGLSLREAAKLLDKSWSGVTRQAQRLGIHFHGPSGAPRMNRNRRIGEWRKELRKIAAD